MSSSSASASTAATGGQTPSGLYTCVTCHVAFKDPENQRTHFQTEWHAYNLKRKVAAMVPVSKAEFESKVEGQEEENEKESERLRLNFLFVLLSLLLSFFSFCHSSTAEDQGRGSQGNLHQHLRDLQVRLPVSTIEMVALLNFCSFFFLLCSSLLQQAVLQRERLQQPSVVQEAQGE